MGVYANATYPVKLVTNPVLFLFETHCTDIYRYIMSELEI